MTNQQKQRKNRGFIENGHKSSFNNLSYDKKLNLLKSKIATERTLAARLLQFYKTDETVSYLIMALKNEQKLYSKIEICNTLTLLGNIAIMPLINCLGKIGNNQHKTIPEKPFLKDSYPLPRDIASRTLSSIGKKAMPKLLIALQKNDLQNLSELIDAIGHIHFNYKTENIFNQLKSCYYKNETNSLIKWKLIRAFSGVSESAIFLQEQYHKTDHILLKREIERSLRLIDRK